MGHGAIVATAQHPVPSEREAIHLGVHASCDEDRIVPISHILCIVYAI
jgi:hypothetical protein